MSTNFPTMKTHFWQTGLENPQWTPDLLSPFRSGLQKFSFFLMAFGFPKKSTGGIWNANRLAAFFQTDEVTPEGRHMASRLLWGEEINKKLFIFWFARPGGVMVDCHLICWWKEWRCRMTQNHRARGSPTHCSDQPCFSPRPPPIPIPMTCMFQPVKYMGNPVIPKDVVLIQCGGGER